MKPRTASSTALIVAAALRLLCRSPHYPELLRLHTAPEVETILRSQGMMGKITAALCSTRPGRLAARMIEKILLTGVFEHFAARKIWIDRRAQNLIQNSPRPLLINVGAGLDLVVPKLLAEIPSAHGIEVDHPATQAAKTELLALLPDTGRLSIFPADLFNSKLDQRISDLVEKIQPSVIIVICEGVLMYLPEEKVRTFFTSIAGIKSSAGSNIKILFTYMQAENGGPGRLKKIRFRSQSPLVELILRGTGEEFKWGAAPHELDTLLYQCGWKVVEETTAAILSQLLPQKVQLPLAENVAVAELLMP